MKLAIVNTTTTHPAIGTIGCTYGIVKISLIIPKPTARETIIPTNHEPKLIKFAIRTLKWKGKKYDFCYIHLKETDVPGHDNKPFEKKNFIEMIDKKFMGFLKSYVEKNKIKLIVTGDHATVCRLKEHTADPLPVLLYDPKKKPDKTQKFSESESLKGDLKKIIGKNLLKKCGFLI